MSIDSEETTSPDNKSDTIEEIQVDLPPDLICTFLDKYVRESCSPASYSIVEDALATRSSHEQSIHAVFEAVGRAVFNEIMLDILMAKVKSMEIDEQLEKPLG